MTLEPAFQRVHLLGICGTAMAALAGCLQGQGRRVTGTDQQVYPPMSDHLRALGIAFHEGYRAANIPPDADLVVVGNVIRRDNPEAVEARRRGLPQLSMAEAIRRFAIAGRHTTAVAGTHGKTTTTALAAHALVSLGTDAGFLVGGIARNFDSNFRLGGGRHFVIEGDEYDSAYFEKFPKFFHYRPDALIFTSLEFDHADIYPDLATIRGHFARLLAELPREGLLIACADDPEVRALAAPHAGASAPPCPVVTYGFGAGADCRLEGWRATSAGGAWETVWEGERESWALPMPGRHNALNATAVVVLARRLGFAAADVRAALVGFQGVRRRQEVRGEADGVLVLDDFAHHPTAVRLTLEAVQAQYPERRLWAVFEPRSFTARSNRFQREFGAALAGAARVLVAPPFRADHAGGAPPLDSAAVAAALEAAGTWARAPERTDAVLAALLEGTAPGDVVLVMSNGGFDNLHARLLEGLRRRAGQPPSPPERS